MGIVTNIIDAIRRFGSPTQKTALERLDAGMAGKEVLGIERKIVRDSTGSTSTFIGTTRPVPETVGILTSEEVRPLKENAEYELNFLREFQIEKGSEWELEDLDVAFGAWQKKADKTVFTDLYVVEVLGAMFGEYCTKHLDMRWIKLTDQDGTTLAIEGVTKDFRAFPYSTISKRIRDEESGFFRPVFRAIRQFSKDANVRG